MQETTLKLNSFGDRFNEYAFAKKKGDPLLCHNALGELFTLPSDKTTPISFVISDKKLPNSYKVKFFDSNIQVFYGKKWHHKAAFYDARKQLRQLGLQNKEFWVSLYWEE